ncbi:NmrA-like family protein [Stachybotrys elegans]|uniref:NmrA-like family protein n=1 Tax=Stachybotrys elegans TaxID=80388 RepID=A0A8K0SIJ2_9HYPO|nr:NmrA-like family protein [Stachybotrys elegans]
MTTFLVTQATGQQSLAVISHLLASGAKVHAIVRNPDKAPEALKQDGITIFKGESVNFDQVLEAAQGCKGVFLNTFPWPGLEAQQAKTIVQACKKAGVEGVVAATTFLTGDRTVWDDDITRQLGLLPYFSSKAEVEDIVRGANFTTYTILRPSILLSDLMLPGVYANFPGLAASGELDHACNDGVRIAFTDTYDIGKYAASALLNPDKFSGLELDMANEYLTIEEVRKAIEEVTGRSVGVRQVSPEEVQANIATVFGRAFHLYSNVRDFSEAIKKGKEAQSKTGIPFTPYQETLKRDRSRLLETLPAQ